MPILSILRATVTVAALVGYSVVAHAAASSFDAIYVFGDSYSDVGNIYIATGGATPGPPYYNGRFSNGPIWVDHIAGTYGLTLKPSLAGGTDYAVGGAEVTAPVSEGSNPPIPSVPQQVELYLQQHNGKADPKALYIVTGGGNDILNAPAGTSSQQLGSEIAAGLGTSVELLERAGARYLLVPNLFDIGKLPAAQLGIASFATATTLVVNQRLNSWLLLEAFAPQTHLYRSDAYDFLQAVFTDGGHFGFTDVTDPCLLTTPAPSICSNPYVNLFWDLDHLTLVGHSMLATLAVQALHQQ